MTARDQLPLAEQLQAIVEATPEWARPRSRFREFNEAVCRGERGTLEFDIVRRARPFTRER